jgi:hypothetical protein
VTATAASSLTCAQRTDPVKLVVPGTESVNLNEAPSRECY